MSSITYVTDRGETHTYNFIFGSTAQLLLFTVALLLALLGAVVHRWTTDSTLGLLFLGLTGSIGCALATMQAAYTGWVWPDVLLSSVLSCEIAALLIAFALHFPVPVRGATKITRAVATVAIVLAVADASQAVGRSTGPQYLFFLNLLLLALSLLFVCGIGIVVGRATLGRHRGALRPVLVGFGLGIAPYLICGPLSWVISLRTPVGPEVTGLGVIAIPISFRSPTSSCAIGSSRSTRCCVG